MPLERTQSTASRPLDRTESHASASQSASFTTASHHQGHHHDQEDSDDDVEHSFGINNPVEGEDGADQARQLAPPVIVVANPPPDDARKLMLLAKSRPEKLWQTRMLQLLNPAMALWDINAAGITYDLPQWLLNTAAKKDWPIIRWARINVADDSWRCEARANILYETVDGDLAFARGCDCCFASQQPCLWRGDAFDSCQACVKGKAFCGCGGRVSVKFTDEFLDHLHVHHGLDRNPIGSTCEPLVPKRYFRSFDGQVYKHTAKKLGLDGLPRKLPQRVEPPLHPSHEVVGKWDQHAKEAMEYAVYCATRAAAAKEAYKLWERKEWEPIQDKGKKRAPESFESTTERNKRRREEAELVEEAERREALARRGEGSSARRA